MTWGDVRYEVPGSWQITFDPQDDRAERQPYPVYGQGYCDTEPGRALALAVLTLDESTDDAERAVAEELQRSAEGLFAGREPELMVGELQAAEDWASTTGTVETAPSDDPCDNESALIAIKGGSANDGTAVSMLVVVAELDHPDSPTVEDVVAIVNSMDVGQP